MRFVPLRTYGPFRMAGLSTNAGGQLQDFLQNIPTDRTEKIITHNFIFAQACPHEESRTAFAVRLSLVLPVQRD